jgi:hypothetical protein
MEGACRVINFEPVVPRLGERDKLLMGFIYEGITVKDMAKRTVWTVGTTRVYLRDLYKTTQMTRHQLQEKMYVDTISRQPEKAEALVRQLLRVKDDEKDLLALIRGRVLLG